jgi:hypothetical protein
MTVMVMTLALLSALTFNSLPAVKGQTDIITLANGSLVAPALAFETSKGTGVYYGGSHSMVFTSNKVAKFTVNGSGAAFNTGTASATSGAATLNSQSGTITSESITTAAGAAYTLTLSNTVVTATSRVFASADNGTNSQGELTVTRITPSANQVIILVKNSHASQALNGTIKINFFVVL